MNKPGKGQDDRNGIGLMYLTLLCQLDSDAAPPLYLLPTDAREKYCHCLMCRIVDFPCTRSKHSPSLILMVHLFNIGWYRIDGGDFRIKCAVISYHPLKPMADCYLRINMSSHHPYLHTIFRWSEQLLNLCLCLPNLVDLRQILQALFRNLAALFYSVTNHLLTLNVNRSMAAGSWTEECFVYCSRTIERASRYGVI